MYCCNAAHPIPQAPCGFSFTALLSGCSLAPSCSLPSALLLLQWCNCAVIFIVSLCCSLVLHWVLFFYCSNFVLRNPAFHHSGLNSLLCSDSYCASVLLSCCSIALNCCAVAVFTIFDSALRSVLLWCCTLSLQCTAAFLPDICQSRPAILKTANINF